VDAGAGHTFRYASSDGAQITAYRWDPAGEPRAVIQLTHGMGEHAQRFDYVARALNDAGFVVYAQDHRGHGATADPDAYGDLGPGGWTALVDDIGLLSAHIREDHADLPLILVGHSMGSFAAQQYVLDNSALIAGLVLSGSAAVDKLSIDPSQDADLTAFNRAFEPARTPHDWLSRDPAAVDAYEADPLCGFGINKKAMEALTASAIRLIDPAALAQIRKDLPIYIFAGDKDPINHDLEWLKPLAERYRAAGIENVSEKYYPGGRHEMLNETNRDEVMRDLASWLQKIAV